MIKTYNRTICCKKLAGAKVHLILFDGNKYDLNSKAYTDVTYYDVESYDIIDGIDGREIESEGLIDDEHEYLVLHFSNGDTATFRNSRVDMFIH